MDINQPIVLLLGLVASLVAGFGFVWVASWLSTKKGNTMKEILESQRLANAEAIKVEVLNKFKLSSTIPIVALFMTGALVAIGPVCFAMYLYFHQEDSTITVRGWLDKYSQTINPSGGERVYVRLDGMSVSDAGAFVVRLPEPIHAQLINFESPVMQTITLSVVYSRAENELNVSVGGYNDAIVVKLVNRTASLEDALPIHRVAAKPIPFPPNIPSQP